MRNEDLKSQKHCINQRTIVKLILINMLQNWQNPSWKFGKRKKKEKYEIIPNQEHISFSSTFIQILYIHTYKWINIPSFYYHPTNDLREKYKCLQKSLKLKCLWNCENEVQNEISSMIHAIFFGVWNFTKVRKIKIKGNILSQFIFLK